MPLNMKTKQFIVEVRLQAVIRGLNEQAAMGYAALKLQLESGKITDDVYLFLVDDITTTFATEDEQDKYIQFWAWIDQSLVLQ